MPNGVAKRNLPQKTCRSCGRPFTWRKKWERDWDQVLYCSDRCRAAAKAGRADHAGPTGSDLKGDE